MRKFFIAVFLIPVFQVQIISKLNAEEEIKTYPSVLINELMPNPEGSDTDFEWIELINTTKEDIDITNWKLKDKVIPEDTVILKESYLLFAKNPQKVSERYQIPNSSIIELSFTLKNTEDVVSLVDLHTNIIDSISYQSTKEEISLERMGPDQDIICKELQFHPTSNSILTENYNFDNYCWGITDVEELIPELTISEIMINPKGSDKNKEWIKLKNLSDETIKTLGFIIKSTGSEEKVQEHCPIIQKYETCLVKFKNQFLHNDFGEIKLVYNGNIVNNFEYVDEINEDTLIINQNGEWKVNSPEVITEDEEETPESETEEETSHPKVEKGNLIFTEIYPSPNTNEEEWIEIHNQLEENINLTQTTIHRDSCDGDLVVKFASQNILSKLYLVVKQDSLKKSLLNAGGTLVLCNNTNEIDKVIYPAIAKGESYSLFNNEWYKSDKPSQGVSNTKPEDEATSPKPQDTSPENEVIGTEEPATSSMPKPQAASTEKQATISKLQSTSTNPQSVSYKLPNVELKDSVTDLDIADVTQLKSGMYVEGYVWIIFLLMSLVLSSVLLMNNRGIVKNVYTKFKKEIQSFEIPREYFRR